MNSFLWLCLSKLSFFPWLINVAIPTTKGLEKFSDHTFDYIIQSGGQDTVNFYVRFSHYLPTGNGLTNMLGWIFSRIALGLYNVASGMQFVYVHLFDIFGVNGRVNISADGSTWYQWVQVGGFAVFMIVLLIYVGAIIFNPQNGAMKFKKILFTYMSALFLLFGLPFFTSTFSTGVSEFARIALSDGNKKDDSGNRMGTIADDMVRNNVVSITSVIAANSKDKSINIGGDAFTNDANKFAKSAPYAPIYINLDRIKNDRQKEIWNGFEKQATGAFLQGYGSEADLMNDDQLKKIAAQIDEKDDKGNPIKQVSNGLGWWFGGSDGQQILSVLKYHLNGSGDKATLTEFNQFQPKFFHVTPKGLAESYLRYQVQWGAMIGGLIVVVLIFAFYSYKLITMFYRAFIMYATSGYIIMRNADKGDKLKSFFRSYSGLFEMLMLDVVILSLFFNAFFLVNDVTASIIYASSFGFASPILLFVLRLFCWFGLVMASVHGIDELDSQLGQPSGQMDGLMTVMTLGGLGRAAGATAQGATMAGKTAIRGGKAIGSGAGNAAKKMLKGDGVGKDMPKPKNTAKELANLAKKKAMNKAATPNTMSGKLGNKLGKAGAHAANLGSSLATAGAATANAISHPLVTANKAGMIAKKGAVKLGNGIANKGKQMKNDFTGGMKSGFDGVKKPKDPVQDSKTDSVKNLPDEPNKPGNDGLNKQNTDGDNPTSNDDGPKPSVDDSGSEGSGGDDGISTPPSEDNQTPPIPDETDTPISEDGQTPPAPDEDATSVNDDGQTPPADSSEPSGTPPTSSSEGSRDLNTDSGNGNKFESGSNNPTTTTAPKNTSGANTGSGKGNNPSSSTSSGNGNSSGSQSSNPNSGTPKNSAGGSSTPSGATPSNSGTTPTTNVENVSPNGGTSNNEVGKKEDSIGGPNSTNNGESDNNRTSNSNGSNESKTNEIPKNIDNPTPHNESNDYKEIPADNPTSNNSSNDFSNEPKGHYNAPDDIDFRNNSSDEELSRDDNRQSIPEENNDGKNSIEFEKESKQNDIKE